MKRFRILSVARLIVIVTFLYVSLSAQTNQVSLISTPLSNDLTNSSIVHPRLFQEGNWILSYGLGYGGVGTFFYAFGFSLDPYKTSHVYLHSLTMTLAADYFFGNFFNIGVDFTMGGNLNRAIAVGGEQLYGGYTQLFFLLTGLRTLVHYSFTRADVYGGISIGLGLTRQTFFQQTSFDDKNFLARSNNHWLLGWIFRLGSRFHLSDHQGIYVEIGFPFIWISLGGYYQIK